MSNPYNKGGQVLFSLWMLVVLLAIVFFLLIKPTFGQAVEAIDGQWYRVLLVEEDGVAVQDTVVAEFTRAGVLRMWFMVNEYRLPPKYITYNHGVKGFIFVEGTDCGRGRIGTYQTTVHNDALFISYLIDGCQNRAVVLVGIWHAAERRFPQPVPGPRSSAGKPLERIQY